MPVADNTGVTLELVDSVFTPSLDAVRRPAYGFDAAMRCCYYAPP